MLIYCGECEKQVSDQAEVCPYCGYKLVKPSEKLSKVIRAIQIVLWTLALLIIVGGLWNLYDGGDKIIYYIGIPAIILATLSLRVKKLSF